MNGVQIFWTIVGVLVALRIIWNCYMRWWGVTGRHHTHYWDSDFIPTGSVWMDDGVWYTCSRASRFRTPRRFDERSNPLDHEYDVSYEPVPQRKRAIYTEREY